jgi:hypothetical protein
MKIISPFYCVFFLVYEHLNSYVVILVNAGIIT